MADVEVEKLIKAAAPDLDGDLLEYVLGYFEDSSSDRSKDALVDFLQPLLSDLSIPEDEIDQLCADISKIFVKAKANGNGAGGNGGEHDNDDGPRALRTLDTPMLMNTNTSAILALESKKVVDIRHTNGRGSQRNSSVDLEKLRAEQERAAKKKAKRAGTDPNIPKWDPNSLPAISVNQAKATSDGRGKDIKLENFDISLAGKVILTNADLTMVYGRRYGLVGKNGIGKSTLLRSIGMGELVIPSHIKVLHVEQEIHGDDTTAVESVLAADVERDSLIKEEKLLNTALNREPPNSPNAMQMSKRLKDVYTRLEEIEADKAESRAAAILNGLGFSPEQQKAATRTFSGGWRMRLALARALFCKPDLLLADEVTNYLDFPAVVFLEDYFTNHWPATLLVVSHDRAFLDAVATDILHLQGGKLEYYKGNFTTFVATRSERKKNAMREYEAQLQYRQHLQAFIDRWRYNANRAAQAQSKIKILEKLPPLEPPTEEDMEGLGGDDGNSVYFTFPPPEKLSPPIMQMNEVSFGYDPSRIILRNISFDLQMDSKVAIVGPNGAGKSTMIKLLTSQIEPQSGIVHRHGRLRIGLFSQHHVDQLELSRSSVEFLQSKFPGMVEEEYRRFLGRFGITGTTALQPIGTLSGGQKSRVAFAWLAMTNPHILLLDEPTNHLDIDSIDALAKALREFKGGIAIVSHDERFLDAVCNEVWVCAGGRFSRFEGKTGVQIGVVRQYKKSLGVAV